MTLSYTLHLKLAVPDFLSEPWHAEFAQAMDSIDQAIFNALISQTTTLWLNSTAYVVGNVVIDPQTGTLWTVAVAHTTAASPTLFAAFKAANPTFYTSFTLTLATQAEAEAGIENTKYMSALRVAQAILAQSPIPGIASQAQAAAGIDNTTMMTPLRTAQSIAVRVTAAPTGRLTLTSLTPILTANVSAATLIYYTPYIGQNIPLYNGINFDASDFLDEIMCLTTDTAKNPAAIGVSKVNDWFVWNDTNTVTITIAAPAVLSYTAHGFQIGHPFQLTTTGALATGLLPDTTYYVIAAGFGANSFQFSLTRGGAAVNTSGTESGVHTLNTRRLCHGPDWTNDTTRSAGTALVRTRGFNLNAIAITNGPAALRGTYVGTTRSDVANKLNFVIGVAASGGLGCLLNVWNAFNRVQTIATVTDNGVPYTYSSATVRQARASAGNQVNFIIGLAENPVLAWDACTIGLVAAAAAGVSYGLGLNQIVAYTLNKNSVINQNFAATGANGGVNSGAMQPIAGYNFVAALQNSDGNANTFDSVQADTLTCQVSC